MKNKIIIGITGGIGSGKTTICKTIQKMGYPVFYSDQAGREILSNDVELIDKIASHFGDSVLDNNKQIIRSKLGEIVFNNSKELAYLNALIHPRVKKLFINWVEESEAQFLFKESAILFETNDKSCDFVCTIFTNLDERVKRVMARDKVSKQAVLDRMKNQWDDKQKVKLSDFVIYNNTHDLIIPQINSLVTDVEKSIKS